MALADDIKKILVASAVGYGIYKLITYSDKPSFDKVVDKVEKTIDALKEKIEDTGIKKEDKKSSSKNSRFKKGSKEAREWALNMIKLRKERKEKKKNAVTDSEIIKAYDLKGKEAEKVMSGDVDKKDGDDSPEEIYQKLKKEINKNGK